MMESMTGWEDMEVSYDGADIVGCEAALVNCCCMTGCDTACCANRQCSMDVSTDLAA